MIRYRDIYSLKHDEKIILNRVDTYIWNLWQYCSWGRQELEAGDGCKGYFILLHYFILNIKKIVIWNKNDNILMVYILYSDKQDIVLVTFSLYVSWIFQKSFNASGHNLFWRHEISYSLAIHAPSTQAESAWPGGSFPSRDVPFPGSPSWRPPLSSLEAFHECSFGDTCHTDCSVI